MNKKQGILYGVGVGPGDPELLTLKAVRVLKACPVVAAPRTREGRTLALDIARGAMDLTGKVLLFLDFAMSRSERTLADTHQLAARQVLEQLAAGQDVALLTLGDVSVYSSFCYVMDLVRAAGYETVMIPGVPSFCASAAALGRSLTEMNEPLHILPVGGHLSLPEALALPGTKVLMKAGRQLPQAVAELEQQGLAGTSALVMNCGLPDQQLCPTLHEYRGQTGYFATLLVGKPKQGAN